MPFEYPLGRRSQLVYETSAEQKHSVGIFTIFIIDLYEIAWHNIMACLQTKGLD